MDTELMTAKQILEEYGKDVRQLSEYIPWLTQKSGAQVSQVYGQDGISDHSLSFPVFDSDLMRFIKDAEASKFMNRNYRYAYTRYKMYNSADEKKQIQKATILQMQLLGDILSKYVMGGRTKARLWNEGVGNGVFLEVISKAKELTDFWANATNETR